MNKTKPSHYPIDLLALAKRLELDPYQFNALKYICRAGKKEGETYTDDISKAVEVLQMALEYQTRKEPIPSDMWDGEHGTEYLPEGTPIHSVCHTCPSERPTASDYAEYHNPDHTGGWPGVLKDKCETASCVACQVDISCEPIERLRMKVGKVRIIPDAKTELFPNS